ncbi:MAG: hypothetical protein JWN38_1123 [Candidatus Saccharibacteria bacterium]|nr:hypothetical protein [Candidatus Saccharibacteria bacterium]
MIDDFKPVRRRPKSLDAQTNTESKVETPKQTPAHAKSAFETPEQVAAHEAPTTDETAGALPLVPPLKFEIDAAVADSGSPKPSQGRFDKLKLRWPPSKKEAIAFALVIVVVVSGLGSVLLMHKAAEPAAAEPVAKTKVKVSAKPVAPTTVPSNLTGRQIDPALNNKPVTAVMIENSTDARPQSGLSQAGVVFEAVAEGGITRFVALFQDTSPEDIGPIRSVRPYYLQWAMGFDAPLAHVGGSPEALSDVKSWGAKDLDQFYNGGSYHRITSRAAPHNVYTGLTTLNQLEAAKGWTTSQFTTWKRKEEAPVKTPTAKTINFSVSGAYYNSHYDYDTASNSYKRSEGGAPHMDANGNVQISPKVVIGLVIPYGIQSDGKHSDYGTIGSGKAYVFQDGTVTIGNWSKATDTSQILFTTDDGKPLALDPGQTWLTAISDTSKVTYAP